MVKKNHPVTAQVVLTFWIVIFAICISSMSAAAQGVAVIPLIKNHISAISPADVVRLGSSSIAPNAVGSIYEITPAAANAGEFTVPAGKYLVITSISVFPQSPGAGNIEMQLIQDSSVTSYWKLPNAQPSHLSFGPGMLIDTGYTLTIKNWATSPGNIRVSLYGYLTNK